VVRIKPKKTITDVIRKSFSAICLPIVRATQKHYLMPTSLPLVSFFSISHRVKLIFGAPGCCFFVPGVDVFFRASPRCEKQFAIFATTHPPASHRRISFYQNEKSQQHSVSNLYVSLSFAADPPEIEVERNWVHSGEGYEAQLVCIVHAEPPAEVSAPTSPPTHSNSTLHYSLPHFGPNFHS
jgi:hypothetical protein